MSAAIAWLLHLFLAAFITIGGFFSPHLSPTTPPPSKPASPIEVSEHGASSAPTIASSTPAKTQNLPVASPEAASSTPHTPSTPSNPVSLPSSPAISAEELNTKAREAVVNILCTTQTGGSFAPITGSGVIIDPRGVILTNAHVAQFFLLRDYPFPGNISCVVRTGSPAKPAYTAELLYLPPQWISDNADQITKDPPMGTGENDFAFLRITGTTDPSRALPSSFPYISLNYANPNLNDQMFLASYPAGFLEGISIQENLYLTTTYATVGQLYVFDASHQWIDLFSIPGSTVSQAGSSGGAAINRSNGELSGIIVTDTNATTTANRDLRAISIEHIEHSLISKGFTGIPNLLSGNLSQEAANFNDKIAPELSEALIDTLKHPAN